MRLKVFSFLFGLFKYRRQGEDVSFFAFFRVVGGDEDPRKGKNMLQKIKTV